MTTNEPHSENSTGTQLTLDGEAAADVVRDHHTGAYFDSYGTLDRFRRLFDRPDEGAASTARAVVPDGMPVYDSRDLISGGGRPLFADTTTEELRDLYAEYGTIRDVARELDRSEATVSRVLHALDVPRQRHIDSLRAAAQEGETA